MRSLYAICCSLNAEEVKSHLHKGANATLRSRVGKVKARLAELAVERDRAPGKLDAANKRAVPR